MELKPCPFCGSTDVEISFRFPRLGEELRMLVVCNCCGCMTAQCRNEDKAVEAWNRRGKKPFYRKKKWKHIYWDIPYCPHCKQELGLNDTLEKPEKCSECGRPLEWDDKENKE